MQKMGVYAMTHEDHKHVDRSRKEERPATYTSKTSKKEKSVLLYLHDLAYLLGGVLLLFLLVFRVVIVSGPSMLDTLVDGDYLLLLSNTFYTDPQPGDIVVASKYSYREGEPIVKRVIATEGQEVNIDFEAGIVYVDGVPLEEEYTLTPTNLKEGTQYFT